MLHLPIDTYTIIINTYLYYTYTTPVLFLFPHTYIPIPLTQEPGTCLGACRQLYEGKPCYRCHDPDPSQTHNCSFALDLGNARCVYGIFFLFLCVQVFLANTHMHTYTHTPLDQPPTPQSTPPHPLTHTRSPTPAHPHPLTHTHTQPHAHAPPHTRSAAVVDMVPTFTTNNERMCLLLSNGDVGMLRTEDAERLQGFEPRWTEACYPVMQQGNCGGVSGVRDATQSCNKVYVSAWCVVCMGCVGCVCVLCVCILCP